MAVWVECGQLPGPLSIYLEVQVITGFTGLVHHPQTSTSEIHCGEFKENPAAQRVTDPEPLRGFNKAAFILGVS